MRHLLLMFLVLLPLSVKAQVACSVPDEHVQETVRVYVSQKYSSFPLEHLVLTESAQAANSCFWKITFTSTVNGHRISVFLSPDQHYITPTLFDLAITPQQEQEATAKTVAKDLALQDGAFRGPTTAPVTLVEFSDFQCPYCKSLAFLLEQQILPKEEGTVRVLYRQFPLPMHSWARHAAVMSKCVERQSPNDFWGIHDFLFSNQSTLTAGTVKTRVLEWAAAQKDLDTTVLSTCFDQSQSASAVDQEQRLGEKVGVHGTPTLYINGRLYDGVRDAQSIEQAIEQAANQAATGRAVVVRDASYVPSQSKYTPPDKCSAHVPHPVECPLDISVK